jgi:hypothetical protein
MCHTLDENAKRRLRGLSPQVPGILVRRNDETLDL